MLAPQPFFQHRGTPIAVRSLLTALGDAGYSVDVLTYHEGEEVEVPNCTVHRIPALPGLRGVPPGPSLKKLVCDLLFLASAFRLTGKKRFDLIHAVEEGVFVALLLSRVRRLPYIYDMDSHLTQQLVERYPPVRWLRPVLEGFERRAVRQSIGVVAVCRALEETAKSYAPTKLVGRIEDTTLLRDGSIGEGSERIRETIARPGPIVMYVGNLQEYQGIGLLLEGFRVTLHGIPDAHLVVIGGGDSNITKWREYARRLDMAASVHFLGSRPIHQLGWYLGQAEVLVSPRTQGVNTPMKIYSYLDSGVPVLATRLTTHTQVLDDDISYLVEPNPTDLGEGLARLLRDPALREELATRARRRVDEEFTSEAFERKVVEFYASVEREMRS